MNLLCRHVIIPPPLCDQVGVLWTGPQKCLWNPQHGPLRGVRLFPEHRESNPAVQHPDSAAHPRCTAKKYCRVFEMNASISKGSALMHVCNLHFFILKSFGFVSSTDFFQILVVASSGLYARTFFEFLKKNFFF